MGGEAPQPWWKYTTDRKRKTSTGTLNSSPATEAYAKSTEIETERLLLRQWKDSDSGPFAALCANAKVMEFFPSTLSREESDAMLSRCRGLIEERGWGLWAVESKVTHGFMGFVGLHIPAADLPFSPSVEIGWRLSEEYWGKGYATEAAQASLEFGFRNLNLQEIVSFTAILNQRSQAVMKRIGMHQTETFEHPRVPEGHPLRAHCLFRISREIYKKRVIAGNRSLPLHKSLKV
jgi:RimJ/RimL family protein N-acetyltransferase